MILQLARNFHVSNLCRAAQVETSLLAKLRKKTGYTLANCKKALEMHNNDVEKAETWLHDQAQSMGWSKATKLAGREASQGLVAVRCDHNHATLVEINCETDFVARNENFQAMVEEAANACYKFAQTNISSNGPINKLLLNGDQLKTIPSSDGKTLGEKLVLMIGSLGENAILRRAECWKTNSNECDIKLAAYTHPAPVQVTDYSAGKYGALLAYRQNAKCEDIGRKICQHIVGLNPRKIGNPDIDKPFEDSDDETCLIYQEYLIDPNYTVQEVLHQNCAEVIDYVRYACGESIESNIGVMKQILDSVPTLQ